ncbi:MAG: hypothetical protein RSF68_11545 [Myroides sp.]
MNKKKFALIVLAVVVFSVSMGLIFGKKDAPNKKDDEVVEKEKFNKDKDIATNMVIIEKALNKNYSNFELPIEKSDYNIDIVDDKVGVSVYVTFENSDKKVMVSMWRSKIDKNDNYVINYLKVGNDVVVDDKTID